MLHGQYGCHWWPSQEVSVFFTQFNELPLWAYQASQSATYSSVSAEVVQEQGVSIESLLRHAGLYEVSVFIWSRYSSGP